MWSSYGPGALLGKAGQQRTIVFSGVQCAVGVVQLDGKVQDNGHHQHACQQRRPNVVLIWARRPAPKSR